MRKAKLVATEHEEAVAFMQWCDLMSKKIPGLDLIFAIPNGGHRNVVVAGKLKAEGVKAGIPDYFLPVPKGITYTGNSYIITPGLFLELKRSNGVPSDVSKAQKEKMRLFEEQGYKCVVAFGWEEAAKIIEEYLGKSKGRRT